MESKQSNNDPNEEALFEFLTLTCEIDEYGDKIYRNKEGEFHRIHGPAVIWKNGNKYWYKNDKQHREDGPAVIWENGEEFYVINGIQITKEDFIQWQKDNGIKPSE